MSTNKITRKEALKRIGGLALGSTVLPASVLKALESPQSSAQATTPAGGGRPNILWITLEGVPLSVLSCYGSRLIQTPHIDRIAREGMQFRNAFTTNALCAPSRATLLTGKYDHLNGMISNPGGTRGGQAPSFFDPAQQTCAQILRRHGYQTGMVGKWHLVSAPGQPSNPGTAGFDYFIFKRGAGGPYYSPKGYLRNSRLGSTAIEHKEYPGYITDNFTDFAIEGMKQFKQPFLMMVQYFNDHRPFNPPHKYEHLYDGVRIPEPGTFWDDYTRRASPAREARMRIEFMPDFHPPESLTDRQRQQWNYQQFMAHFLGTLKALDENVGRLLNYLDEAGLSKNTVVVITSDHGFFMGDHGWFDKRFMYEPAIRVPWLIRYPGVTRPGSGSDAMNVNIDNAPTILSLAGLEVPADMQGASLLPHIEGNPPKNWRDSFYYHYYEFAPPHWVVPHYGVRTDRYKLISYYTINEWELFDLQKDPDEMESLIEWSGYKVNPDYEPVAKDLLAKLKQLREHYKDTTGSPVRFWPTRSYD
jgi:arylsulfatase A-like enzyme